MCNDYVPSAQNYAFIVRIWWEQGLSLPDGRPLWRGQVQDAAGGQPRVFQSLDDMVQFIRDRSGVADEFGCDKEVG